MPNEKDSTKTQPRSEIKILRANNVEVPENWEAGTANQPENPELAKLRSAFFAGEKLKPEELTKMMALSTESAAARNGNCNIC